MLAAYATDVVDEGNVHGVRSASSNSARLAKPHSAAGLRTSEAEGSVSKDRLTPSKAGTCEAMMSKEAACVKPINTGALMKQLKGWILEDGKLVKVYAFRNYYETMAFVNATAWISHHEDHHPDLEIGYDYCRVTYTTHAIRGLSENDFICAAKIDRL